MSSDRAMRVLTALLDGESYSFKLAEATGLKAGTLYPVLWRLLAEGWVEARWGNAEGRRRRYYHLTARGERAAREQEEA